jgi:hypothetical protein
MGFKRSVDTISSGVLLFSDECLGSIGSFKARLYIFFRTIWFCYPSVLALWHNHFLYFDFLQLDLGAFDLLSKDEYLSADDCQRVLFFIKLFEFSLKVCVFVFEWELVDFVEPAGFDFGLLEFFY